MNEIVVDHAEIVAMIHGVEQLLAHAHQRRGAAGSEIEPAEQFEPPRLAGDDEARPPSRRTATCRQAAMARSMRGAIMAERGGERLEEGDARPGGQFGVARQDFLRQRDAGSLAAAGQQLLA